jgi:hypothetical protein
MLDPRPPKTLHPNAVRTNGTLGRNVIAATASNALPMMTCMYFDI